MTTCRTCIGLDCDDGPALGTYSLQRVILPEVTSTSGQISVAALGASFGCLDSPYSSNIVATGRLANSQTQWSVIGGSLPTGLTLVGHGNYATLSGTPTSGGIYRFTVLAEASNGGVSARAITFPVYRNWVPTACAPPASGTVQNLALGTNVFRMAYCPTNECIYALSGAGTQILVVYVRTGLQVAAVTVPASAEDICYASTNDRLYVTGSSGIVSIINPSTNLVVSTVSVDPGPFGCAFGNSKVYVGHGGPAVGDAAVSVLSTSALPSVSATIDCDGTPATPEGINYISYSESDKRFYSPFQTAGGGVWAFNGETDSVIAYYAASGDLTVQPYDTAIRSNSTPDRHVFVLQTGGAPPYITALTETGVASGTVNGTVGYESLPGIAYRSDADRIYAATFQNLGTLSAKVFVIDPVTMSVESEIALADASSPQHLIFISDISQIVVSTNTGLSFITP